MPSSSFSPLQTAGLSVTPTLDGDVLRVVATGTVDMREPGALLDPYWSDLDQAIRRDHVRQVELDLSGLDYMNSSGILTLVRWIMGVRADPAYQFLVHYDENLTWQKTNVPVLAKLAPSVLRLSPRWAGAE